MEDRNTSRQCFFVLGARSLSDGWGLIFFRYMASTSLPTRDVRSVVNASSSFIEYQARQTTSNCLPITTASHRVFSTSSRAVYITPVFAPYRRVVE